MHIIEKTDNYNLYWHDDARTIIVLNITQSWTWDQAHHVALAINHKIVESGNDVFTIFQFNRNVTMMPTGGSVFTNIKNLMMTDLEQEKLVFFVAGSNILRHFMNVLGTMSMFKSTFARYRFADSLEAALAEIEAYLKEQA